MTPSLQQPKISPGQQIASLIFAVLVILVVIAVPIYLAVRSEAFQKWRANLDQVKARPVEVDEPDWYFRVWESMRPDSTQEQFRGPVYYVRCMPVDTKDCMVIPTETWPEAVSERGAANTIAICSYSASDKHYGNGSGMGATLEEAICKVTVCFVDPVNPRRRRWITGETAAPTSVSIRGGKIVGTTGGFSTVDGQTIPERLWLKSLVSKVLERGIAAPGTELQPIPVNTMLPLRSVLWTPGKESYFPSELTLSPDDTKIALVTGKHAIFWTLPDGNRSIERFRGDDSVNDAVIPTHGWDSTSRLKVRFHHKQQIRIKLFPGNTILLSKDVTCFGPPWTSWNLDPTLGYITANDGTQGAVGARLHRIWPIESTTPEQGRDYAYHGRQFSLSFSPDGDYAVAISYMHDNQGTERRLLIWSTSEGSLLHDLPVSPLTRSEVVFTPDSHHVAVSVPLENGSAKCSLRFHNLTSGLITQELPCETAVMAFTSDSSQVAMSEGATIRVWSLTEQKAPMLLKNHVSPLDAMEISRDGKRLYGAAYNARMDYTEILKWDLSSGDILD